MCAIAFVFAGCSLNPQTDVVAQAQAANKQIGTTTRLGEDAVKFLVDAAEARMMESAQGQLAATRGTTEEIRAYGKIMVEDQAMLLMRIQETAIQVGVTLPATPGESKQAGLDDLKKKTGLEFDAKFIKMITIDHERDVREFGRATKFDNVDVRRLAVENLPVIQRHLADIQSIEKARKPAQ